MGPARHAASRTGRMGPSSVVKYLLFATNFIIFVLNMMFLAASVYVLLDKPGFLLIFKKAQENIDSADGKLGASSVTKVAYAIIGISSFNIIISFIGCFGAVRENKCLLSTYFGITLGIFIVIVIGGIIESTGVLTGKGTALWQSELKKYKEHPNTTEEESYKNFWNELQSEMRCCGVDSASNWRDLIEEDFGLEDEDFSNKTNVPSGCCHWQK